mmetsp:Transcript_95408/g.270065  ORF Transcript_95408/g.270065 Transcript_95408/m.270065 type:complete len:387 (-) Transcript_95408:153-1313(-)
MAPKASVKRPSSATAARAKKAKVVKPEHELMLEVVLKEVKRMEALPSACIMMLQTALPHSLGVPKDERIACQSRVVEMTAEALAGLRAEKERTLAAEAEKVADVDAQKVKLDAASEAADKALSAKADELTSCTAQAAEATAAVAGKKKALAASVEAQRVCDVSQKALAEECAKAEAVVQTSLSKLAAGDWESASDAEAHLAEVAVMAGKVELQESLAASFRTALGKKPAERGPFDSIAVQEVEKALKAEVSRLRDVVAEFGRTSVEKASAVEAARAEVEVAEGVEKERAAAMDAASARVNESTTVHTEAAKEVHVFKPAYAEAVRVRDRARSDLDAFLEGPFAMFEKLKDRVSTPPEEAADAQAAAGEDVPGTKPMYTECGGIDLN